MQKSVISLLKDIKLEFLSFILGLIIASSLVLIPFDASYDVMVVVSSLLALIFGGVIVLGLGKLQ